MRTGRMRGHWALVAAVTGLAATAVASAATTSRYEGKVKGAGPVSFRLNGTSVARFRASVSVTCVSSSGGRSEAYLLAVDKSAKLDRHGAFTLTYKQDKRPGGPFPLYKINATVKGKVGNKAASGTVTVTYYKQAGLGLALMGCSTGNAKWSANRK